MSLTRTAARRPATARSLLKRLIEMPDLPRAIRSLSAGSFAALVRDLGVEDAGELIAMATTEQLVCALDEDLFVAARAGQREAFDAGRFVVWLEVLLEAGDQVAASRVAELDEDLVAHALSSIALVLDEQALRQRLLDADENDARQVDKALESALAEDLDGYLLVARRHDGWDAMLALVLALDRDHRALLVRLLDRLAAVSSGYLDDLDELSTVLTEAESLADEVEAAREERRSRRGHVEARAARGFLALAREAMSPGDIFERDPLTRAYFREFERRRPASAQPAVSAAAALPRELREAGGPESGLALAEPATTTGALRTFTDALRDLREVAPDVFAERMEELAYLANVLVAGHERGGARLMPLRAADAVLATVCYGAILELRSRTPGARSPRRAPTRAEQVEVLRARPADLLFRLASSALATGREPSGLLHSADELEVALASSDPP